MQDRQYQAELITNTIEEISNRRKIVVQLPTGGGKTVCFSLIAQRYIRSTGKAVLILVHREELMHQAARTIRDMLDIEPCLITSKTNRYSLKRVYIGMVDSTISRLHMFDNVGLVIVDECHIANFNKMHQIFLEELIIGFSATPVSSSKKEPLNKYYSAIVTGPQISELIKLGFLAQNITRCPKDIVDATKFEIDKLKGDYNERQMATEYKLPKHVANTIRVYHKFCRGKKTIVFNVNIEHSKEVTDAFVAVGYNARHIDSDSSKRPSSVAGFTNEREEILHWFKITEDAILCNVMIATVGFDEPTIQNVITNFSTLSLTKAIQCWGRGGRIIDKNFILKHQKDYPYKLELKSYFNIIDMGGNCIKFGDWNDDRDWRYIFNHPDRPGEGVAPVKTCPDCEGIIHAAIMVCPLTDFKGNPCLHEFQRKKSAEESDLEEMILVTKGINVDELIGKNNRKYEYYTFLEMGVDVVKKMYEIYPVINDKISIKYFNMYYELCKQWYRKTLAGKNGNIMDISDSSWHIRRAKNNFDALKIKYEPKINDTNEQQEETKLLGN